LHDFVEDQIAAAYSGSTRILGAEEIDQDRHIEAECLDAAGDLPVPPESPPSS